MKKICVYTCITGDYDNVKELAFKEAGIDYLLFTNNRNLKSETWDVIYFEDFSLDNHRLSRKIKILGHPIIHKNYNISVWIDGSIIIKKSIKEFIEEYCDLDHFDFASFKHHERDCIFDEANECIRLHKDNASKINLQMKKYRDEGYPKHAGLNEMTVFVKKHNNNKVIKTMNMWFDLVCRYSKRDQLAFNYVIYKTGLKIKTIHLNIFKNEYFEWKAHTKRYIDNSFAIYYDEGEGFTPQNADLFYYEKHENTYKGYFRLKKDVESVRIDITDFSGVMTKVNKIEGVVKEKLEFINLYKIDDQYLTL